jgi:hypothetical protein
MKKYQFVSIILALTFVLTACGGGGGNSPFPLPKKYDNLMATEDSANFQTPNSIDEMVDFYRGEFIDDQGLTERGILTVMTESTVSMVFDGHSDGRAVVLQMVDLGDGNTNVNVRFEDV